jgi:hypothetical protein
VSFTFTMEETEEGGCCKGDLDRLPHEVVLVEALGTAVILWWEAAREAGTGGVGGGA